MLDLEAGVHLEERQIAAVVEQELTRPSALVSDGSRQLQRGVAHPLADRGVDARRTGFLEDLLVPPLDRAIALAEMDAIAVSIEQDLDLDVPRPLDEALEDEPVVAECGRRFAPGSRQLGRQPVEGADGAHALPAATGRRLDQKRNPDPLRGGDQGVVGLVGVVVASGCRDPEVSGDPTRGGLVAHGADGRRRGTDPGQPGIEDRLSEVRVLGEEAEPRVDGIRAGAPGGIDDGLAVEEVERVQAGGVWHHHADGKLGACPGDPPGDLAAVGHEDRPNGTWRVRRSGLFG